MKKNVNKQLKSAVFLKWNSKSPKNLSKNLSNKLFKNLSEKSVKQSFKKSDIKSVKKSVQKICPKNPSNKSVQKICQKICQNLSLIKLYEGTFYFFLDQTLSSNFIHWICTQFIQGGQILKTINFLQWLFNFRQFY